MILITSIDRNFGIGYKGSMLFSIHEDMMRFKDFTTGNIVVMGRGTLESLPKRRPLKNRINVVCSRSLEDREDLVIVRDLKDLDETLMRINPENKKIYLIGGADLVKVLLPKVERAELTRLERSYEKCDSFLPNLDLDPNFELVKEEGPYPYEDTHYSFLTYLRVQN